MEYSAITALRGAMSALSCIALGLLYLLANRTNDGKAVDNSAHWITGGGGHVRYATEREVWEHNNPGKSWYEKQQKQRKGCLISLIPAALILPAAFAAIGAVAGWARNIDPPGGFAFILPVYAVLFGIVIMVLALHFSRESLQVEYGSGLSRVFQVLTVGLSSLGLLYMLVFAFSTGLRAFGARVPDSRFYIFFGRTFLWVCAGAAGLLLLDRIVQLIDRNWEDRALEKSAARRKRAEEEAQKINDHRQTLAQEFVMRLVKDRDLKCGVCNRPFRLIDPNSVRILGKECWVCEKCLKNGNRNMSSKKTDPLACFDIDWKKARDLANDIRSRMQGGRQ